MSWIGVVFISSMSAWERVRELVDSLNKESEVEKSLVISTETSAKEVMHSLMLAFGKRASVFNIKIMKLMELLV